MILICNPPPLPLTHEEAIHLPILPPPPNIYSAFMATPPTNMFLAAGRGLVAHSGNYSEDLQEVGALKTRVPEMMSNPQSGLNLRHSSPAPQAAEHTGNALCFVYCGRSVLIRRPSASVHGLSADPSQKEVNQRRRIQTDRRQIVTHRQQMGPTDGDVPAKGGGSPKSRART